MIYTFSREMVEEGLELADPYVLISISTPPRTAHPTANLFQEDASSAFLPPDEFRLDVLRLRFDDLDEWPRGFTDRQRAHIGLYSPEMALQVAAFVRGWEHQNIVVHCDAGISRSQGMANAIADHKGIKARHSGPGYPNRLVYRLTYDALRPGETMRARLTGPAPVGGSSGDQVTLPWGPAIMKPRDKYRLT